MEWCEKLYGETRIAGNLLRLERTVIVFFIFVMITGWVCSTGTAISETGKDYTGNLSQTEAETEPVTVSVKEAESDRTVMFLPAEAIPAPSEILAVMAAAGCDPASVEILDMPQDIAEPELIFQKIPADTVPAGPAGGVETVPAEPEYPAEILPPASASEAENPSETVPTVVEGFLVDESGMICGIEDPAAVSDGYLVLPSEGCMGITAGAFADAPAVITEIYIPANITHIEAGAFAGLVDLEWLEAETSDHYYTEDGVLFSENGTCILGFPSARTGNYKVPDRVTRFAEYAFEDAKIEVIDAVSCTVEDTGNLPPSIRLIQAGKLNG